ncbi:hypothetical protein [Dyadobacter sp. CY356]|uniref:hypothetical protein n=1 Tax=Dyadobacter sp. CY356 TaxID=2906442 RepID=UPI00286D971C|nr:hypothetical protein [Dyadobacter sp. CY356]
MVKEAIDLLSTNYRIKKNLLSTRFNTRDIERVEVLKNAGTAGIYGIRGGNGVIAFYSMGARSMQQSGKQNQGMTPVQFIGYPTVQREFYVPRYDTVSPTSGPVDDRDVLYWKPMIQTDNQGNSQLRFSTVRSRADATHGYTGRYG